MANDKNDEEKVEEINETDNDSKEVAISREKIGGEVPIVITYLTDKCLYSGFFGTLDSNRMQKITEKILELLTKGDTEMVVIDLGNIEIIDSAVAAHLVKLAGIIRLIGCRTIFCGIRPIIAQTMAAVGVDMSKLLISKDLKSAIKVVFQHQGLKLVPIEKEKLGKTEDVGESFS